MSKEERRAHNRKMREGWSEDKLKEWKAGWKAKTTHWKKRENEVGPPAPKRRRKTEAERLGGGRILHI